MANPESRARRRPSSLSIWIAWMVLSYFGGLLGQLLTGLLGEWVALGTAGTVSGAVLFFTLGITQAMLLRHYVIRSRTFPVLSWALVSGAGGSAGTLVGFWIVMVAIMGHWNDPVLGAILIFIIGSVLGGLLALCQVPLLAQYTSRADWWVLGNSVGWSVASLIGVFIVAELYKLPAVTYYLRGTAPGLWSLVFDIVNTSLATERIMYGTVVVAIASAFSGLTLVLLAARYKQGYERRPSEPGGPIE